jgi:hypothetical protein
MAGRLCVGAVSFDVADVLKRAGAEAQQWDELRVYLSTPLADAHECLYGPLPRYCHRYPTLKPAEPFVLLGGVPGGGMTERPWPVPQATKGQP